MEMAATILTEDIAVKALRNFFREKPFFFMQWGEFNKKKAGHFMDGRTWDDMPVFEDVENVRS